MKKNGFTDLFPRGERLKILLTMKMFLFFTLTLTLSASASIYSQNQRVSLEFSGASVLDIFNEIKEQTGLRFIYNEEKVEELDAINFDISDMRVDEALEEIFKDTKLECQFYDDVIMVVDRVPELPVKKEEQEKKKLEGTVTDKDGNTLPGVSVVVKGTTTGVATNIDGEYLISFERDKVVLVFSFVGMATQEIIVENQAKLDIVMEYDNSELEEVIVTGIFNRKASTFTGSVTTFKGNELKAVSNSNVFESLKNLDPSLMIFDNLETGSDPNKSPKMLLRGTSSFDLETDPASIEASSIKGTYGNNPNAPLFILDGFETTVEKIFDLDMDRIESVTILKDASAKAIYGSKAANGVVVIETKVSAGGEMRLSYTGGVSIEVPDLTSYNLMNAAEKLQFEKDFGLYNGKIYSEDQGVVEQSLYQSRYRDVLDGVDTDWLAIPLRNAIGHKHRIGFAMGTDILNLNGGFSYNNIQGAMKGSDRMSYSGDVSISYRKDKLSIRNQLTIGSTVSNDSPYGSFSEYAAMNPYYSPYDRDGKIVKHPPLKVGSEEHADRYYVGNPLYNSTVNSLLQSKYTDITNNLYAEYFWNDYLKTSLRFGIGIKNTSADQFYPAEHNMFRKYTTDNLIWRKGSYQVNDGESKDLSGDFNISYSRSFGKHFLLFNVNGQISEKSFKEGVYSAEGFPSDDMNSIMFARSYTEGTKPNGIEETRREFGGLGVFNYAFDNRLLLDATIRTTGSSQYGANKRWGAFWSTGVGWNIHHEKWVDNSYMQRMKLRASVGSTGAQPHTAYAGVGAYNYRVDRTYLNMFGLQLEGMRNDDLLWQKKFDINLGLDLELFKRLSLTLEFYKATTKNSLISKTIAPSTGFSFVDANVGEIINKGVDLRASYKVWSVPEDGSFLTLSFNASHNRNKIQKLSDAMNEYNARIDAIFEKEDRKWSRPLQKYYEGASTTSIWAMKSDGIDPASGREIFVKKDGTRTFDYISSEQQIMGNSLPDVHGNIGAFFQYKGFGLNLSFRYKYGGQAYNETLANKVEAYDIKYNVDKRVLAGSWLKPGDVKPYARHRDMVVWYTNEFGNQVYRMRGSAPTQRFIYDQNELSLSSITLSYDFWKHNFIKKIGLSRLKISAYGNNLHTWSTVEQERGTAYPFARTFNFSISAAF
ncbi:SusC/RagA family TonB-linked outer membrane protein [Ancylomarina sp. DW003]|nr:SusC/RagA family TonB-linked outer membrane protein [Ancylomarina sp. DW003]MDE5422139.1 SusC/RagA family TonB-linked outer membrane protein [Ancylomarina sp. DW003]